MFRAFQGSAHSALRAEWDDLLWSLLTNNPEAWETMVAALIRAGFVVNGSWPIQTERHERMRTRSHGSAALASSVWLVCKKRSSNACPGWDNTVLDDMREEYHGATPRLLGCRHPGPRLCVGSHRSRRWKPSASTRSSRRQPHRVN